MLYESSCWWMFRVSPIFSITKNSIMNQGFCQGLGWQDPKAWAVWPWLIVAGCSLRWLNLFPHPESVCELPFTTSCPTFTLNRHLNICVSDGYEILFLMITVIWIFPITCEIEHLCNAYIGYLTCWYILLFLKFVCLSFCVFVCCPVEFFVYSR